MSIATPQVTVTAPARLHMGFIDLSGSLGRQFGSIGIALDKIATRLTLREAKRLEVAGPGAARAEKYLRTISRSLNVSDNVRVDLQSAIPEHVGLGSGTQMALAVGAALDRHYKLGCTISEIAAIADRGARSGIGIGVFEHGGLVVDGGRAEDTVTPPVLSRMDVPEDWRFLLVFDERGQGFHGQQELRAFRALPDFPEEDAARICYLILMQGLPALAENKIEQFGEVISEIQRSVGDHFAAAQGGRFVSPDVGRALEWLQTRGAVAIGQTSWGPTGFCAVRGADRADALCREAAHRFEDVSTLRFLVTAARNVGADIQESSSVDDVVDGARDQRATIAGK